MRKVLFSLVTLILLALVACSNSGASTEEAIATLAPVPAEYAGKTNPLGADASAEGETVFKNNCSTCHGPEGHGDGPAGAVLDPAPRNLAELQAVAGDDYLFWRISTGKPGTAMVAWKGVLTDDEIWQAVAYIHTLK